MKNKGKIIPKSKCWAYFPKQAIILAAHLLLTSLIKVVFPQKLNTHPIIQHFLEDGGYSILYVDRIKRMI